jgi:peptidyl-prolyl cis-trans isomerase SurA
MKKIILAIALAMFAANTYAAADRIVAVVNDQVITLNQLNSRVELNMRQLGMKSPNAMQRDAVMKRTLSGLVDEELQRQYAMRANVKMTPQEVESIKASAIQSMGGEAVWNNFTKGFETTAHEKLAAEALWQKIVARDLQPRVQVATSEADRLIAELAKSRHVLDREISVIQLASGDDAEGDKGQLAKLNDLKEQISKGESFADIARAYSEDRSAANGGNLGWFSSGELNPQLEEALDKMQPGQVSEPIRTPLGWYIIKLENVRTTKPVETEPQTQFHVYVLGAPSTAETAKGIETRLDKVTGKLKTPADLKAFYEKNEFGDLTSSRDLGWVTLDNLETDIAKAVEKTSVGRWTKSLNVNGKTSRIYVATTRQVMPEKLTAYRDKVMSSIFANRIELESRRFMQNLRQRAFLDVRL